ncbi:hypothetical protein DV737_g3747, partial [Chaetothyriales sp. CBS 132003]
MSAILTGLWHLFIGKLYPPANPTTSFAGKTILITGANVGLGFEAAAKFVSLGAKTVIMGLDMNSYASIKSFAEKVNQELDQLDVVVLNAGLLNQSYKQSPEGWEETLQVNVLSTTLLALLLLPKLRASKTDTAGTPHLAFVSSGTHLSVQPARVLVDGSVLDHLNSPDGFSGRQQYPISKLFVEYVMREIAALTRQPNGQIDVIVNSLCPGLCWSDLARSFQRPIEHIGVAVFYGLCARSTEQGSRTLVSAVTQGEESHGRWWTNDEYPESGRLVTNEEGKKLHKKVWNEILDALRGVSPEADRLARANDSATQG